MTSKPIKKKTTNEEKEVQKEPLTKEEKRNRAIFSALPIYSKIKQMVLEGALTMEDIEIATPTILLGSGFDRKQVANLFSVTIGFESHLREVRKIAREQVKRLKTRLKFSAVQRRYFENRIIYGYSKEKEVLAEASELISVLKSFSEKQETRLEYLEAGVDLSKLARNITDDKKNYLKICQKISDKLQKDGQLDILRRLKKVVMDAQEAIEKVEDLAKVVSRGYRRPYLKALGKKKK